MPLYDLLNIGALLMVIFLICYSSYLIFIKKQPIDDMDKVVVAVMSVLVLWFQLRAIFHTFV